MTGRSHWYVHWLPVDREYATKGGSIWGVESAVADIDLDEHERGSTTWRLADPDGAVLELHCDRVRTKARKQKVLTSVMHTWLDGAPQEFEVRLNALEDGSRVRGSRLVVNEEHPRGRELARLLLSRTAIATSVMPRSETILFAPERLPPGVLLVERDGSQVKAAT